MILDRLRAYTTEPSPVICIECYPGVMELALGRTLEEGLRPAAVIWTTDLVKPSSAIERMVGDVLSDDPVFGRMNRIQIEDFFDERKLANARDRATNWKQGLLLIVGTGATLVLPEPDLLIHADLARWEIQQRQRRNAIRNFGAENLEESAGLKYKRAFFVDWRAADRMKASLFSRIDFWLDTNSDIPKLVTGQSMGEGLRQLVHRPFRVVPYFDPGPWGGHWMEEVCDLPNDVPNHAWCFDCVPEENSLLLKFGPTCVEVPAMNLTLLHPRELLGQSVYSRFGAEFPIRFDFLDTMGGGNLSLQVHPKAQYIRDKFGMKYTQDESYYLLDAGEDGSVYLGTKSHINRGAMIQELKAAQTNGHSFRAEAYVNKFPARKHDHFLIPAGTIHCSGKKSDQSARTGFGRLRMERRTHRTSPVGVYRNSQTLVHRSDASRYTRYRQCSQPYRGRRGGCRESYERVRTVCCSLCGNLHCASSGRRLYDLANRTIDREDLCNDQSVRSQRVASQLTPG